MQKALLLLSCLFAIYLQPASVAVAQPTPINRLVADCSVGPPYATQATCGAGLYIPELDYTAGRAEGDPPVGPTPFDYNFTKPTLGTTDADDLYDLLGFIHQYVWDTYGRDGGNGHGGIGRSLNSLTYTDGSVYAEVSDEAIGLDPTKSSAYFSSDGVLVFPTGEVDPDTVGHEYAHSISKSLSWNGSSFSGLINSGQSGAIAEAYSDFFGEVIERRLTGSNDWVRELDLPYAARSLIDPTSVNDPVFGTPYPDRFYSPQFYCGPQDGGGVHINAGLLNKMSYLASEGGTHNGYEITGIGMDKVEQIWYRAMTEYFVPAENFNGAYLKLLQATEDLYGDYEVVQMFYALNSVEVNQPGGCSGQPRLSSPSGVLGDYNRNGVIDMSDYNIWKVDYGQSIFDMIAGESTDDIGTRFYFLWADGNLDGIVDLADYEILAELLPSIGAPDGDFDEDGDVDGGDFLAWQRGESFDPLHSTDLALWETTFGQSNNQATSQATVPEPTTLALLVFCQAMLLGFGRRNRDRYHESHEEK